MPATNAGLGTQNPSLAPRFRAISGVAATFALAMGIAALAGSAFRTDILKSTHRGPVTTTNRGY